MELSSPNVVKGGQLHVRTLYIHILEYQLRYNILLFVVKNYWMAIRYFKYTVMQHLANLFLNSSCQKIGFAYLKNLKKHILAICVGGCVTSVPNCSDRRFDLRCTFMTSSQMPKNRRRSFANTTHVQNTSM